MFLILEVSAMIITGVMAIISTLTFFCYTKTSIVLRKLYLLFFLVAGSVGDPASPASFGGWLGYTAINHSWVVSFVIMDLLLFLGVITLTVIQASQV
jgi:palmitoyltransferase ZDHHC13/17